MKQNQIPESVNLAVQKFRNSHLFWIYFICFIGVFTFWNFLAGFLILVLRQLRFQSIDFIGFGLAGIPICLLISAVIASRKKISTEKALAVIDGHNKAGGLIMATTETGDVSWVDRISGHPVIPALKARFSEKMPALILSFLFLVAGMKIPLYDFSRDRNPAMDLKGLEEKALLQIEALEETEILTQQEAEELKETVDQIVKTSDKNDPSKTFEAFDQLEEKIKKEGASSAQKSLNQLEELETLKNMAEKLQNTESSDSESLKSALSELQKSFSSSETAKKMKGETKNSIQKGLESVSPDGSPSAEEAKKAAEELKNYINKEAQRLTEMAQKLQKARVIDRKTFDKLLKEGKIRPVKDLKDLKENQDRLIMAPPEEGSKTPTDGSSDKPGGKGQGTGAQKGSESGEGQQGNQGEQGSFGQTNSGPGNGATTRGPGTAPLNYNRKSSEHNIKFKDEALPDPGSTSLEDSVMIGIGITAPQIETEKTKPAQEKTFEVNDPNRSAGKIDLILPRHRSAVKSFFKRTSP